MGEIKRECFTSLPDLSCHAGSPRGSGFGGAHVTAFAVLVLRPEGAECSLVYSQAVSQLNSSTHSFVHFIHFFI